MLCTRICNGGIWTLRNTVQKYRFHRRLCHMADITNMESEESSKYSTVTEGKATILQPASVFYNPVQEFNRDLTIAVISEFAEEHIKEVREKRRKKEEKEKVSSGEVVDNDEDNDVHVITDGTEDLEAGKPHEDGIKILEGLAASGLRSMRFGLEIPGVKKVIANDFDQTAVEIIKKNISQNKLGDLVEATHADAAMLMYQNKSFKNRFDVIDLDPYGSAVPFLDSAVQAVRDGGLLCITCTDASILCGNSGEKCFTMYGSMSLKGKFCHEMGLRIILHAIESHANRHSRYIVPLISLSIDFYFRVFVRVYSGQLKAKLSASKTGMIYHCTGCGSFTTQPLCDVHPTQDGKNVRFVPALGPPVTERCEHCGFKHHIGGPIYISSMHDREFIDKIVKRTSLYPEKFGTASRIEGMLSMAAEELDVPLYYEVDGLCNILHCNPPKMLQIRSAILNAGYKVSFSHACKNSLKTDAPNKVIWDIMRAWVAKKPINPKRLVYGTPALTILAEKPSIEVCFGNHDDANPKSRSLHMKRWQPNPEKNWGPRPRAKKSEDGPGDSLEERRRNNQGKRKRKAENDSADDCKPSKQPEIKTKVAEEVMKVENT